MQQSRLSLLDTLNSHTQSTDSFFIRVTSENCLLKDLLSIMEKIDAAGAGFRSLTEAIDTTTPAGHMIMQMVGVFAEFEREMIRERTRSGLERARKKGRHPGRKPKLSEDQRRKSATW